MGTTLGLGLLYGIYNALKPSVPKVPKIQQYNSINTTLNADYYLPVVYGEARLEGNIIFYNVCGDKNKYLDIVVAVCEGEIEGFVNVYMDDGAIPIFSNGGSTLPENTKIISTNPLYGTRASSGVMTFKNNFTKDKLVETFYNNTGSYYRAGTDFTIGDTLSESLTNLVTVLNNSSNSITRMAVYEKRSDNTSIKITYKNTTPAGNNFGVALVHWPVHGIRTYLKMMKLSGHRDNYYGSAYFYNGSDAQVANTRLVDSYPATTDSTGWTNNHTLSGISYMAVRLVYNPDLFSGGIPKFSFEVKGRKVYDPRSLTMVYSDNPAICLRDYLLNSRFGKGLDASVISDDSFISAANDCDTLKTGLDVDGTSILYKTYTLGGSVDTAKTVSNNLEYFLQAMNAVMPYYDGKYYLQVLKAGTANVIFNSDNIIGKISVSSSSKKDRYNKVMISFPDKQRHYKNGDAPVINNTYLTEDNGQVLEKSIDAPLINSYAQARDLAELTMNLSRRGLSVSFTTSMEALKAVPGDIVGVSYDTFGWVEKEFRIEKILSKADGTCEVTLSEHDDTFYTLGVSQNQRGSNGINLTDPKDVQKPVITDIVCDKTTHIVNIDGVVTPRILVEWSNEDAYPYEYNIYLKKESDTSFTKIGQVSYTDALSFYIPNVVWGTQYDVGVSVTNSVGYTSELAVGSIYVQNPLSDAIYNYPDVTGLELVGYGTDQGQGNNTDFIGNDIKLQWRLSSENATFEFGSSDAESAGGVGGILPFTLKGYKVEVYHPNDINPRQEYFVTQPNFVYSFDKNFEDGNGTPARVATFKIIAVGQIAGLSVSGESEIPAVITVSNPAPDLPTGVIIAGGFQTLSLSYDRPMISDWEGTMVWISTSSGFSVNSSTLVYNGKDNKILLNNLNSSGIYYVRFAVKDSFVPATQTDATNLTLSPEYLVAIPQAITSDEIQSIIADKIAAGTLGEAVTLGGVFVASGVQATLNGTGPSIGNWRLDLGPVADGGTTYIQRFHDGLGNKKFWIDSLGNAGFSGSLEAATGTFTGSLSAATGTFSGDLVAGSYKTSLSGKRIEINPGSDNEIHFYGDRGDGVISDLATIGSSIGIFNDTVVGLFGDVNSEMTGVTGLSNKIGVSGFSSGKSHPTYNYSYVPPRLTVNGALLAQGVSATATNEYAGYGLLCKTYYSNAFGDTFYAASPLWIEPSDTTSAPTHTATCGSLWVTGNGVLYINTSLDGSGFPVAGTTWQKVGAQ